MVPQLGVLNTTYVIKFVSDLWQIGGFSGYLGFHHQLTATIYRKYC